MNKCIFKINSKVTFLQLKFDPFNPEVISFSLGAPPKLLECCPLVARSSFQRRLLHAHFSDTVSRRFVEPK